MKNKQNLEGQVFLRGKNLGGQAMLVMVIFLSAMMVVASSVASLIVSFQTRQTKDSVAAAQSFFAADAGVENGLYCYFYVLRSGLAGGDASACEENNVSIGQSTYSVRMSFIKNDGSATRDPLAPSLKEMRVTGIGKTGKTVRILESRLNIAGGP